MLLRYQASVDLQNNRPVSFRMTTERRLFGEWLAGRTPLEVVEGYRFPAAAVLSAAGITGDTLTNYLTKTPLELFSRTAGQGRARQFCLIDVYQIALLATFAHLTSKVQVIARYLNDLPWQDAPFNSDESKLRRDFCENVSTAAKVYHHRGEHDPMFVYSDSLLLELHAGLNPFVHDRLFRAGIVINATTIFSGVDVRLAEHLQREEERSA